jgi:DNA repair ATPase RecN
VGAEDVETQKGGFCVSETVTVASLAEKLRNAKEKIKEEAKDLDELRETARQLHDALCWGNRKDIGKKFPRTPLTQEEYNEKSKALHEEGWIKVKDLEASLGDFEGDFARLQKQLRKKRKDYAEEGSIGGDIIAQEYSEILGGEAEK